MAAEAPTRLPALAASKEADGELPTVPLGEAVPLVEVPLVAGVRGVVVLVYVP